MKDLADRDLLRLILLEKPDLELESVSDAPAPATESSLPLLLPLLPGKPLLLLLLLLPRKEPFLLREVVFIPVMSRPMLWLKAAKLMGEDCFLPLAPSIEDELPGMPDEKDRCKLKLEEDKLKLAPLPPLLLRLSLPLLLLRRSPSICCEDSSTSELLRCRVLLPSLRSFFSFFSFLYFIRSFSCCFFRFCR